MTPNLKLTSSELSMLWTQYANDSLSVCVFTHFLSHIDDESVRPITEHAMQLSQQHVDQVRALFEQENCAVPRGFTKEEDLHADAPRLFSDIFYVNYINGMAMVGMATSAAALAVATRADLRQIFTSYVTEAIGLQNLALSWLLEHGVFVKPPVIPMPAEVDFVEKQGFLTGFFGTRRPLNAIEITGLYVNILRNCLGECLIMGFAQTAQAPKIRDHMLRGKEIAAKHKQIFAQILTESELSAPSTWATEVTTSTTPTFSDKLMLFHVAALTGAGIGNYGVGIGTSQRRDLGATYARLQSEVMLYAEDGAELAISHGWLEQPPMAINRRELAHTK